MIRAIKGSPLLIGCMELISSSTLFIFLLSFDVTIVEVHHHLLPVCFLVFLCLLLSHLPCSSFIAFFSFSFLHYAFLLFFIFETLVHIMCLIDTWPVRIPSYREFYISVSEPFYRGFWY